MTTNIQQQIANEIYGTTQQQIKAMSQMWNLESYHGAQQYPMSLKEENLLPMTSESMMFHPFFAHQIYPPSFSQLTPTSSEESPQPTKKKPQPVPEDQKDQNYRDRRRRNNEAARKSREQKRKMEESSNMMLRNVQMDNNRLRQHVEILTMEVERLRSALAHSHLATQQSMMAVNNNTQTPSSY